ncbi:hypothetical protein AB5N19_11705 [Seiridium cardinale]|uniref:Carbohydrate esterase family 16 protein n=1 Tax=Seiridium cardinale TaxID=138064 RepID=A0ABR2XE60_9PEZI
MAGLLPLITVSLAALTSATSRSGINGFTHVFAFGDSYTADHFDASGAQPNASNPIGNPAYPGSTTSGGPNWVGYLVAEYNNSLALAYDFAIAGATVDSTIVPPYQSAVKSFVQQAALFDQYYGSGSSHEGVWASEDSLFTSWFGINDILRGYSPANWSTVAPQIIEQYFDQVQQVYDAGARSFVVFMVPPIQRAPSQISNETTATTTASLVNDFNDLLQAGLSEFESSNADATVWFLNTTTIFDAALDNPSAFGAADATCYNSDGTTCLWWNDLHPGLAIHRLVAEAVKNITATRYL